VEPLPESRSKKKALVKKGEFREGAHTAHGIHRSKTIYRKNIGVYAFDPHGPFMGSRTVFMQ
jgi:hypothetical protein